MKYLKLLLVCIVMCFNCVSFADVGANYYGDPSLHDPYYNLADDYARLGDWVKEKNRQEALQHEQYEAELASVGLKLNQTPETLVNEYTKKIKLYEKKFSDGAKNLFLALAIIGMVWSFGQLALKGSEFSNIGFEVVRVMLVVGFFWWLIMYAPTYLFTLFSKFGNWASIGNASAGVGIASTTDLFPKAFDLCNKFWDPSYLKGRGVEVWIAFVFNIIFALFILITVMFIFVNMVIMNVEFVFMCYVGIFILGLSGASWTRDIAITYLRKLLGISLSYFGLLMICNIGFLLLDSETTKIIFNVLKNPEANIVNIFESEAILFLLILVLAKLVNAVPNLLSQLVGGGASEGYKVTAGAGAIAQTAGGAVAGGLGAVGKAVGGTTFGLAKGTVLGTARAGRSILGGQFRGAGSEFASGFSGLGSFAKNMFTPKTFRTMDGGANAFSNIGKR